MQKVVTTITFIILMVVSAYADDYPITIISYNVENFFDATHDTLKNDYEYLAQGNRHWTYTRFERKAEHIAQVLANISGFSTPVIIGLCEVENEQCMQLLCRKMPHFPYKYVITDSPDQRGVDVALLYDSTAFTLIETHSLTVDLKNATTRDILYAKGTIHTNDTLHIFLCHLPAMLGGRAASQWKRERAKTILQQHIDSITLTTPSPQIIVMGDMNDEPKNDLQRMTNKMITLQKEGQGTEKFQGHWSCLDQFYVSTNLDSLAVVSIYNADFLQEEDDKYGGRQPKRTFKGFHYQRDGYSDHLPIVMHIRRK